MIPKIALIGDYDPAVIAHQAIPLALRLATEAVGGHVAWDWVATDSLGARPARKLEEYQGIWTVPATPYADAAAAIAAIRFARESGRPFLGTCGGF